MGLIIARVKMKCPQTGEEVDMIKDCGSCGEFKHWGFRGAIVVVTCEKAPKQKGRIQKGLDRLKNLKTEQWLQQAREDGVVRK